MEQMGHPLNPPLYDNVQACDQDKLRFWGFFFSLFWIFPIYDVTVISQT